MCCNTRANPSRRIPREIRVKSLKVFFFLDEKKTAKIDSFHQEDKYARIERESSRRKACPPRLPSGFCRESCSRRIKDMPCL